MTRRANVTRRRFLQGSAGLGLSAAALELLGDVASAATTQIRDENLRAGTPRSAWWPGRDRSLAVFPAEFSVAPGDTVVLKVLTDATDYTVSIYRLGWYGGDGARLVHSEQITWRRPQEQPPPATDPATLLVDCSTWSPSATWTVPADAVSGVYLVNLRRADTGGANHTYVVVRRPEASDLLVQTSEMTWHAYNRYGGSSLYWSAQGPFADRVSYQRPLDIDGIDNEFLSAEYPLVRWLERNGFDVAYGANLDTHRYPSLLTNRRVFVSSGHDEYWSGPMRANVEAARDAGVHLMFLSGNEVFWRVRLEPSIGPGAQADQTITCFKETTDNGKTDPSSEWTGTWRDPRFSPPGVGGGNPENRLTGQLFKCIYPMGILDATIEVPARFAPLRFWRNTPVASLAPGTTQALGRSTLGYEWDVDVDDDHRPPGLIQLSETVASAPDVLQDFGSTYAPGRETHHLTLYRAPSGALVFGAGTVQWAFGLDEVHQSDQVPADRTMQQATMNLLADMGVQPSSPQADLVTSAPSTDTRPPSSQITSPPAGSSVPVGTPLVITGTASDQGGGVVAGVEVSIDDGRTWRRATGTETWSHVVELGSPLGPRIIRSRATDDSANTESPAPGTTIEVIPRALPATLFPDSWRPAVPATTDVTPVEVGLRFRTIIDGSITALRCYRGPGDLAALNGTLWSGTGVALATVSFPAPTAEGWQEIAIAPVAVRAGADHVVSVWRPQGRYGFDIGLFASAPYEVWPLLAPISGDASAGAPSGNGLYRFGSPGFPTSTYGGTSYGLDIRFDTAGSPGTTVSVLDTRPADGLELVSSSEPLHIVLSDPVDPTSVTVTVDVDQVEPGAAITGTVGWSAGTRTLTFTPSSNWVPARRHQVRVTASRNAKGDPISLDHTFTFTAVGVVGALPTGLVDTAVRPAVVVTGDTNAVELGVRVQSSVDGVIRAVRAYVVPGSPGPIVGRVWRSDGTLAATAVISERGATDAIGFGWRQAALEAPVPVRVGEIVTVSYHAPGGVYAANPGQFATSSLERGPLRAPASAAVGGNGVYRYGPSGYPTSTYQGSWYLTDLVFDAADLSGVALTVVDRTPAPDLVAVAPESEITVVWSGPIDPSTSSVDVTADGSPIAGSSSNTGDRTVVWRPATPLPAGAMVNVSATARPAGGGAPAAPATWSLRIDGGDGTSPATLWTTAAIPALVSVDDPNPVELGVVWRSDVPARAVALRFFKADANDGPHVGRLWTGDGVLLGTATFANTTRRGWQQAPLDRPVPIAAGATYVASYHAPTGRYSATIGTFAAQARRRTPLVAPASTAASGNGRFVYGPGGFPTSTYLAADYGVDVVVEFEQGLSVVSRSPAPGASGVPVSEPLLATFDREIDTTSLRLRILDDAGAAVLGRLDVVDQRTVRWTPDSGWPAGRRITVSIESASALDGAILTAPVTWQFDTEVALATSWSLFSLADRPAVTSADDVSAVELGVRVRCDVDVDVVAIRHYVGPRNPGPHRVRLWNTQGVVLAEATAPTGSGWVETRLPSPVPLTAGTVVVASYLAPVGGYAFDVRRLSTPITSGPLTAPADGVTGPNGCFRYGGGFPDASYLASSYGVDIVVVTRP